MRSSRPGARVPAVALLLACGTAAAQLADSGADSDSPNALETVTVTATRVEAREQDVAAAISEATRMDIMREAPDVLAEALRGTPGAFFQQTTPGQGIPIIRGLKGSQVLHLVDGMRLNNAFFRDAPNQYLALVDAYATERVEVLRGAAGALYGADAMGGVVQVLTREPRLTGPDLQTEYRLYGGYTSADSGWVLRGETTLGREGAAFTGGATWQDYSNRRTGGGETVTPSGYRARAADAKTVFDVGASGEFMASAQVLEQPSTPRTDELVPGYGQTRPASERFEFQPNRRTFLHGRYRLATDAPWFDEMDLHIARQVIVDDRLTQDFGSPEVNRENNESELDGVTAQFLTVLSERLRFTWGAEWYWDTVRSERRIRDAETGHVRRVDARFPDGSTMDSAAAYLTATWMATDRLELDAGLRYSAFDIVLAETGQSPAAKLSPDDVTGEVRMVYALDERINLAANLGRGFRPPNIFDLGTLGPRPGNRYNVSNPDLDPETVWSYDVGLKALTDDWQVEAFVFLMDYRDKITSVPTGATTSDGRTVVRGENRNEVTLYGLEAGARWRATDDLDLFGVLNWTRGEERDRRGVEVAADRVPPLNGKLGLRWRARERLDIEPYLLFAGEQDRLSPRDVEDPRIDPDGTDGWLTLNVGLTWRARAGLDFGLRIENLTDEEYREHGSGIDAPGLNVGMWLNATF